MAWWALLVGHIHPLVHHGHLDPAHLGLAAALLWWTAMITAMMLPLVAADARWLAFRSLPRLRRRAITVFVATFLLVWALAGAVGLTAMAPLHGSLPAVVLALAVAAAWHVAPVRRRVLRRCGALRAPAIRGPRAALDWSRSGAVAAGRCIATCWALMLPMAILHSPALMVGGALVVASERRSAPNPERRAGRPVEAMALLGLAVGFALFA
jgi:hypothetical protein